ncbi:MAG: amidohydrolase family protein [Thermoanaerobaculia bacterium]
MSIRTRLPAFLLAALLLPLPATARPATATANEGGLLAFEHVRVFDGQRVLTDANVLVAGGRIVSVGKGADLPAGVEAIDGRGRTLLPGLIDAHVHVFDGAQLEQSLAFGVTTVLDMFSVPAAIAGLKSADRSDWADLRSAGILATAPGGHGTEYGIQIPTISAPEEAQTFADARFAEGSDYLKIVYDDGSAYGRKIPTVSEATLRALVAAAHARGKMAVVHIGTFAEARTAIDAGADGIVHLFRDPMQGNEFGAFVASHGAFVTATLAVLRTLEGRKTTIGDDPQIAPYLSPAARAQLAAAFPMKVETSAAAVANAVASLRLARVPVLCGTDAPNPGTTFGASMHDELALLVEAGLTPIEALEGATSKPAQRFGLEDRGRILKGKRADLVLVEGDPTTAIADSRKIVGIWRGGVSFDRGAYRERVGKAAEAAKPQAAPVASGPISDFEDGTPGARFGQAWVESTDAMIGGASQVALAVVDDGAGKAFEIRGAVAAGAPSTWAGAIYSPGTRPFSPVDLSRSGGFRFRVRAEKPGSYVAMLFSAKRGRAPLVRTFDATTEWSDVSFAWGDFEGYAGDDVMAIFLGQSAVGPFRLMVDDVALR